MRSEKIDSGDRSYHFLDVTADDCYPSIYLFMRGEKIDSDDKSYHFVDVTADDCYFYYYTYL